MSYTVTISTETKSKKFVIPKLFSGVDHFDRQVVYTRTLDKLDEKAVIAAVEDMPYSKEAHGDDLEGLKQIAKETAKRIKELSAKVKEVKQ